MYVDPTETRANWEIDIGALPSLVAPQLTQTLRTNMHIQYKKFK